MGADRGAYAAAGVDEEREQAVFARAMRPLLAGTVARSALVRSVSGMGSGYFASIVRLADGPVLALTTDGVGTKILVAREAGRYEPVGVDCVANNVNDLLCVGAEPVALLDYLALDRVEEPVMAALARGLAAGAEEAGIAIPGGEIAQIGAMLAPSGEGPPMLDLVGTALGVLPPGRDVLDGSRVAPGDAVIALPSSGLHSNGYSLARQALFERGALHLDNPVPGDGRSLADALLEPTRIYVRAAAALWDGGITPHGLVNVTGGGLLNLARLAAPASYHLDTLPEPPPLARLIQEAGDVPDEVMHATFNMGVGFCAVVADADAPAALRLLQGAGETPTVIGHATPDPTRSVHIPHRNLTGRGDTFERVG